MMPRNLPPLTALFAAVATATAGGIAFAEEAAIEPSASAFFETKIRPVLVEKCYKCHSAESGKSKGGLALDTREGIRMGGDSGHAVVPGDLKSSLLIEAMRSDDKDVAMPPRKEFGQAFGRRHCQF